MKGNDQVRFCSHCNLSVQDLSQMTTFEAERLVLRSKGRLCLRIHRTPVGEVITRQAQSLYHISRRASRIAAGAFTAMMSVSTAAYAQSTSGTVNEEPVVSAALAEPALAEGPPLLTITVVDLNGAAIPGANVTLTDEQSLQVAVASSDGNGRCRFPVNGDDTFSVVIDSFPGFKRYQKDGITLSREGGFNVVAEMGLEEGMTVMVGSLGVAYEQPLVIAASDEDYDEVKRLLRSGVDVNQAEEDGTTALDLAVARSNLKIARRLLRSGANAEQGGESGRSPLFWLSDDNSGEMLKLLLQYGAFINRKDADGCSPLIQAASYSDGTAVQSLINAGADVNAQNEDGYTALMNAAVSGNEEAVKDLLAAGAIYGLRNNDGEDALMLALKYENEGIVELLHAAGAVDMVRVQGAEPAKLNCRIPLTPSTPEPTREGED
jgi:hypothetical protein